MRRVRLAFAVALVALFAGVADAQAAQKECVGAPADEPASGLYWQERTFTQAEAWRINGPNGVPTHLHVDFCLPDDEQFGNITLNVRLGIFNKPAAASFRNVAVIAHGDYGDRRIALVDPPALSEWTYPEGSFGCGAGVFCYTWVSIKLDFSGLPDSGQTAFMVRAFLDDTFNGRSMGAVAAFSNVIENGKPRDDFTAGLQDVVASAQWDSIETTHGPEYCRSRWNGEDGFAYPDAELPSTALTWYGRIADTDRPSPPPVAWSLGRDGNAHQGVEAVGIRSGTALGEYAETVELEPGLHKITQRVDCDSTEGAFAGLLSTWVQVPGVALASVVARPEHDCCCCV